MYTPQCVSCIPFIPWVDTWVSSTFGYHECCNELGYTNPSVRPWFQKLLFIIPRSRISESYDFLNFLFIYGCSGSCCCARAPLQFCRSGSSLALSSGLLPSSVERAPLQFCRAGSSLALSRAGSSPVLSSGLLPSSVEWAPP